MRQPWRTLTLTTGSMDNYQTYSEIAIPGWLLMLALPIALAIGVGVWKIGRLILAAVST